MGNFFLMFWGFFFASIFIIAMMVMIAVRGNFLLPIILLSIFVLIGVVAFYFGFRGILKKLKLKKLAKTGTLTKGRYVTSGVGIITNNSPRHYIVFAYKNKNGETIEEKTGNFYYSEYVDYLRLLKEFDIKYDKKNAVIVEKINYDKLNILNHNQKINTNQGQNAYTVYSTQKSTEKSNQIISKTYKCLYCGKIQKSAGKCKNCGATIEE